MKAVFGFLFAALLLGSALGAGGFAPKQEILAQWSNGLYYPASVGEVKAGQLVEVRWEDGSSPMWVGADSLQDRDGKPLPAGQIVAGALVSAPWTNGVYYPATIGEVKAGTLILVKWQDGSAPNWMDSSLVRPAKGHGLDPSYLADTAPSAPAQPSADDLMLRRIKCAAITDSLDCMRSFECGWQQGKTPACRPSGDYGDW